MSLTQQGSRGLATTRSLLNRLLELPDLARTIEALPARTFAALVRKIGVEDAGELVALATTEQLLQAFDEDLFVGARAGSRETLDADRFAVWLEILVEAGDDVAAERIAALDEDFVAHALSGIVLVLEEDALRERLDDGSEDESMRVDKALESALSEELDGYVLVAKHPAGWDAALALILSLDRNQRGLLVRLLDRLARVGSGYLEDLEQLSTLLSEGESLADDVESAREERRGKQGYVEPQAARAFLSLARKPLEAGDASTTRDPLTRAYFRQLEPNRSISPLHADPMDASRCLQPAVLRELDQLGAEVVRSIKGAPSRLGTMTRLIAALRALSERDPRVFGERFEELAYLANVLLAGHERDGARLRPKAATDAVLATVAYGAVVTHRASRGDATTRVPSVAELTELLWSRSADLLFRVASSALAAGAAPNVEPAKKRGLLYSAEELETATEIAPPR